METWGERERALYRYLTCWADFTPAEARDAILSPEYTRVAAFKPSHAPNRESIECPMEQDKNRWAA